MALPNIFTQTAVEAGIWTAAVGTQNSLADAITSSVIFWGIVTLAIGVALMRFLFGLGTSAGASFTIRRFVTFLFIVAVGISFLKQKNGSHFSPVNANGTEWRSVRKVSQNPKYNSLQQNVNGLYWYTLLHRGIKEVAQFMTDAITRTTGNSWGRVAPEYLLNALAQTARATIDDPAIERTFDRLSHNCADTRSGAVLNNSVSIQSMFNVATPECQGLYRDLSAQLRGWATGQRPNYIRPPPGTPPENVTALHLNELQAIDNKIIASAVKNYARRKAGEAYAYHNTNEAALIGGSDVWVNVQKGFSTDTFLVLANAGMDLFGAKRDLEGYSARNEAAVMYNKLLQFLPAVRGYAAAILAYMFLVAAVGMCVGIPNLFLGWLKMTAIFALYQPFSAALYQFTTNLISTTENISAMNSIIADPMVLAGAHILDSNVARITAVYFCMQLALIAIFAGAGIRALQPVHSITHSYLAGIVRNGFYAVSAATRNLTHSSFSTAKGAVSKPNPQFNLEISDQRKNHDKV